MIRKTTLNLNDANTGKQQGLLDISKEFNRVVNSVIDYLWERQQFSGSFVKDTSWIETWLSARMKQCASKQALAIVKSQRKKQKKMKPVFSRLTMELDSRFIEITEDVNSFDCWLTLSSIGNKLKLHIPTKKHRHFNGFIQDGWTLKKSLRIRVNANGFWADVYFEKAAPAIRVCGIAKGFDIGYKKLLVDSDGQHFGADFQVVAEKIARKQQGSKGFLRALTERNQCVNRTVNEISLEGVSTVVVEHLKSVKYKSKGKIRKSFNNKLQRWVYPLVLQRIAYRCERAGVLLRSIDPAYTSQTCSACGIRNKLSRNGERFTCRTCGFEIDADENAALNILQKGRQEPIVSV